MPILITPRPLDQIHTEIGKARSVVDSLLAAVRKHDDETLRRAESLLEAAEELMQVARASIEVAMQRKLTDAEQLREVNARG